MKQVLLGILLMISGVAMAYDLHIENTGKSLEEWISYAEDTELLTLIDSVEVTNPSTGEVISIETPDAAKSAHGIMFQPKVLDGVLSITVSNPKTEDIEFIKLVSTEFGGVVVGDEGEQY